MGAQRALAAIVFTDAARFSAWANADEERAFSLLEADFAVMRNSCAMHEGQVLKTLGDGMLMVFGSAVQAVACAVDIQKRLETASQHAPEDHLHHRIGIHLGDVLLTQDDAQGDGVNIASRLQEGAPSGGVWLSGTVYDVVRSRLNVEAKPLGVRPLKNIGEDVFIYEIPSVFASREVRKPKPAPALVQGWNIQSAALAFVGFSILVFAGVFWNASRRVDPVINLDSSAFHTVSEIPTLMPEGGAVDPPKEYTIVDKTPLVASNTTKAVTRTASKTDAPGQAAANLSSGSSKTAMPDGSAPAVKTPGIGGEQQKALGDSVKEMQANMAKGTGEWKGLTKEQLQEIKDVSDSFAGLGVDMAGQVSLATVVSGYSVARKAYVQNYDFKGMAGWLEHQPSKSDKKVVQATKRWMRLDNFKNSVAEYLGTKTKDNPVHFTSSLGFPLSIWKQSDSSYSVADASGQERTIKFEDLKPVEIAQIGQLAANEEHGNFNLAYGLALFDTEYHLAPATDSFEAKRAKAANRRVKSDQPKSNEITDEYHSVTLRIYSPDR